MDTREHGKAGGPTATDTTPAGAAPWRGPREGDEVPPERPKRFTPRELRFTPQPATRWFSPGVLTASGLHVGLTSAFGSFLDKRELQSSKLCAPDLRYAGRDELWLDYVADTGDGFAATATVACQVAKRALRADGVDRPLPRGDILVFGGDEVYPAASTEGYENRLEGPWRAALPWTEPVLRTPIASGAPDAGDTPGNPDAGDDPTHPTVYALPGNHDWYDGLTGFLRMFGQGRWIGGWRTHQTRSYFAVKLPHRWWLWGIDIQSDALIDAPQLAFFGEVADMAEPGDRLVLATAVPTWTQLERDPHAYRNLAYLEQALLRPRGIDLKLTVAGDLHHYSRYVHEEAREGTGDEVGPTHKITSGGGGAFLHPTHDLPARVEVGITPDEPRDVVEYQVVKRYPAVGRSRLLSLRALLLPLYNVSFGWVPGLVTLVLLWTIQFGLRSLERSGVSLDDAADTWGWSDVAGGVFRNSLSAALVLVLFGGLFAFAKSPPWAPRGVPRHVVKFVFAAVHLAAQVAMIATVSLAALTVASLVDGWAFALVASVVAFSLGWVAGGVVIGAYLAAAIGLPGVRAHANEAFAASRTTGYKNFLRMHIDTTGALTVYALGIDKAVPRRRWRVVPQADSSEASWIEPTAGEPVPHLIDTVTIR